MRAVLPYGRHSIDDDDVAAVAAVLRSEFLTTGPVTTRFEEAFTRYVDSGFTAVCGTGTAALHLAALALEIKPGDAVIVPSITFAATANAVRYCGGDVVFADVDPATGLLSPQSLEEAVARADGRAKAVFNVHLNGQVGDLAGIAQTARRHNLKIVEDACHALGTVYRAGNRECRVGACQHADLAIFSFHPVKTIAMGEGGAVVGHDTELNERIKLLRSHGIERDPARFRLIEEALEPSGARRPWYYEQQVLGYNYRASDVQCALGLSQLAKIERLIDRRRTLAARYDEAFGSFGPILRPIGRTESCRPAWHTYVVSIDFQALGRSRTQIMMALRDVGISTQVHYIPVHRVPYYRQQGRREILPGADAYYAKALTLPLFPDMQDQDVDRVVAALARILGQ